MVNKVNGGGTDKEIKGNVEFQTAPMNAAGGGGKPTKSPCGCGINKPMGDGLTKPQTQWTKRS